MDNTEDPSDYPDLRDWLGGLDQDFFRGQWGHQFSQFSAALELLQLTSLLHLKNFSPQELVNMTGMEEIAAERLLHFAHEDIDEIQAKQRLRTKQARYSY